ncbi:MAG: site-specific tyrosine recombinase [Flavobacteriales bacterium]
MSTPPVIWDYLNYIKLEQGLAENTVKAYHADLNKLLEHFNGAIDFKAIDGEDLQDFIYQMVKKGMKARSQARLISTLRGFFLFLKLERYRSDYPAELLCTPQLQKELPDTLSLDEIDALIGAVDLSKPTGARNRSMLELLYGCGLRASELVNLTLSDLFLKEGFIRVLGKGNKQRLVPIGAYTKGILSAYIDRIRVHETPEKGAEDIVFRNRRGKRLTREMLFIITRDLAKKLGWKKTVSPHALRHSFASHLLRNGANLKAIQQMLGHESITTTEIYLHTDERQLRETLIRFHPRGR